MIDGLAVEASTLDLGEVWEQDDYPYDLTIHNQNETAAEIFDVAVSCGCVEEIKPRSLTIASGTTATIRLKLNLAKRTSRERGLARRPFEVEIHPLRKSSLTPQPGWRLHGIIKSRVTLDTLFLDFGDTAVRGCHPAAFSASVNPLPKRGISRVRSVSLCAKPVTDADFQPVVKPGMNILEETYEDPEKVEG